MGDKLSDKQEPQSVVAQPEEHLWADAQMSKQRNNPKEVSALESQAERAKTADQLCTLAADVTATTASALTWAASARLRFFAAAPSMAVGAVVRTSVKGALEQAFVPEKYRTLSGEDAAWGAVDGIAAGAGLITDAKVGAQTLRMIGTHGLGKEVAEVMAVKAGQHMVDNSVFYRMIANGARGIGGGAAGSLAYSLPHRIVENQKEISRNPLSGIARTTGETLADTTFGGITGVLMGSSFSALRGAKDIAGSASALFKNPAEYGRLRINSFNDMHSNLLAEDQGLVKLSTLIKQARARSAAENVPEILAECGDNFSGKAISCHTEGGRAETAAIAQLKPDAMVPGNHAVDNPAGKAAKFETNASSEQIDTEASIKPWIANSQEFDSPVVASNLKIKQPVLEEIPHKDIPFIESDGRIKPFRVIERNGEKIAVVGVTTDELAQEATVAKELEVLDPVEKVREAISHLRAHGVKKIIVVSHLGLNEDVRLAKEVDGISAIVGAHSHDALPIPQWINGQNGRQVPIMQAGSKAQWLGELDLVFNSDGSAHRYLSSGKLLPVTKKTPVDEELNQYIQSLGKKNAPDRKMLDAYLKTRNDPSLRTESPESLPVENVRCEETRLGNLVSDSNLQALRYQLPVDLFLKQSGDIREGLSAGTLTATQFEDVFCNGHNTGEIGHFDATGDQIQKMIELGLASLRQDTAEQLPQNASLLQRIAHTTDKLLNGAKQIPVDHDGNFLQVSNIRFKYNLDNDKFKRIVGDIQINSNGNWVSLGKDATYKVGALHHTFGKWAKAGIFDDNAEYQKLMQAAGPHADKSLTIQAAEQAMAFKFAGLSQPQILRQALLQNRGAQAGLLGRLDGRVTNLTPKDWRISVPAIGGVAALEGHAAGRDI